ncbi:MAG TPA: FkbM family methyltransferase [Pyrinomonadaceae bacterium]|nr:FkbM family methyltransferase [Pyrinomonadaceae bacterium]
MEIATVVYKKYLASTGVRGKFWAFLRRVLIRLLNDPTCSLPLHGRPLKLPLSHALPGYLKNYQYYDRLPERISEYLHQKQGHLRCIDVGANIGDSIASFYKNDMDIFLAIEPNPKFYKFLVANWSWNKNIKSIAIVCSSKSAYGTFTIQERNGTASILETENGTKMTRQPLDAIVNDYPDFMNSNILKIDTDGHDFEVIAGAEKLISSNQLAVLFECAVFANDDNYVEDCLNTLKFFQNNGYNYFLLYDNYGNLMGKYPLSDLSAFRNLLFFQLTSPFYYFDILVMKDADISGFYKTEVNYFVEKMPNKSLQRTAKAAAEL